MKICPFISHMIGEDRTGVLEIPAGGDALAAPDSSSADGRDEGGVGVKTRAETRAAAPAASHLFCMRETCRFYRKRDGECSFDVMFDAVEAQSKSDKGVASAEKAATAVTKELEKFWKFQTKSVAELISSFGESDQKHEQALTRLEEDFDSKLEKLTSGNDQRELKTINDELSKLHTAAQSREEGMEELSSTVSQMVMSFEDNLRTLRDQSSHLAERIERLESSIPGAESVRSWIEESLASSGANKVSEDVRSLKGGFESLVESSSKFECSFREWQDRLDSRADEWTGHLETLAQKLPDAAGQTRPEETSPERRKKARNLNNLGVTSFHNGELELARDHFHQAVALDPSFAECYNNLGLVLTELNQADKATEAFSVALKLNPELHTAYNNLGYVFYKQGSYDQAIEMYNEALGRSAANTSAYTNLGNAYFKQDKFGEARRAWEKALELDPSNRKAARSLKELERKGD